MKMRDLLKEILNFKELEKLNRTTLPKIPVENIFKNNIENISTIRQKADTYIDNDTFEDLPIESVNINDIFPTQRSLNINNLKKVEKTTKNTGAYLLKNNGKYYVLDGHHRIAINILNGIDKIDAFVFKNH